MTSFSPAEDAKIILLYEQGKSFPQIATLLNRSRSGVEKRYKTLLKLLKARLDRDIKDGASYEDKTKPSGWITAKEWAAEQQTRVETTWTRAGPPPSSLYSLLPEWPETNSEASTSKPQTPQTQLSSSDSDDEQESVSGQETPNNQAEEPGEEPGAQRQATQDSQTDNEPRLIEHKDTLAERDMLIKERAKFAEDKAKFVEDKAKFVEEKAKFVARERYLVEDKAEWLEEKAEMKAKLIEEKDKWVEHKDKWAQETLDLLHAYAKLENDVEDMYGIVDDASDALLRIKRRRRPFN
ncbi:MAG: hypothetical protein HETSPECPRED_004520 [Heterodermia speciosa]|uniref:Uncharacterized protein n=1 Tax=Heterodermia speciosa TaxID=116794 RepID=A0A8H3FBM9_9LECA|nr:MAG: hypothetical protein HETSPECPRED_004520 [Heterodermia speciosa]